MAVAVTYFTKESKEQFLNSSRFALGDKFSRKFQEGTTVVLSDYKQKEVFGVATLANWEGTKSPFREHHCLDEDIYSKDYAKYNKHHIRIVNLHILKNPISYAKIKELVGASGDVIYPNNMWKGSNCSFANTFGSDELVVNRFNIWAKSLL